MTKSIIINSAKILVLVFLIFSISFLVKYSQKLKKELEAKNREEVDTWNLLESVPNPEKEIVRIQAKIAELKNKSVSSKELPKVIQFLINKSIPLSMEVISVKPKKDIEPEGNLHQGVNKSYIEMIIKCSYKVFGQYLEDLREAPMYLTVDSINLKKIDETLATQENRLFITLILAIYNINWEEISSG